MKCPKCGIEFTDAQLEPMVIIGYRKLFCDLSDESEQIAISLELNAVSRRCERRHGCSWATHLEQFRRDCLFTFEDAQVILRNDMRLGMVYLGLRGLDHNTIAEIYCTDKGTVAEALKRLEPK
jgi:hypothetical protein